MVHQHFMLVPTLTVAENVVLGRELDARRAARSRARRARGRGAQRAERAGGPRRRATRRATSRWARRSAWRSSRRSTAARRSSSSTSRRRCCRRPRSTSSGTCCARCATTASTIVLITHKLDEVMEISDTITVMRAGRDGRRACARAGTTPREIARAMVGRDVALALDARRTSRAATASARRRHGAPLLEVRDLVVDERAARARGGRRQLQRRARRDPRHRRRRGQRPDGADRGDRRTARASRAARSASTARDVTALLGARRAATPGSSHIPEDRHAAAWCSTTRSPTT